LLDDPRVGGELPFPGRNNHPRPRQPIYTDTPFGFQDQRLALSRYADELRSAATEALDEEAILIAVMSIYHAD
jgi:hypothetical protein